MRIFSNNRYPERMNAQQHCFLTNFFGQLFTTMRNHQGNHTTPSRRLVSLKKRRTPPASGRRRRRRTTVTAFVALMLAQGITPGDCFGGVAVQHPAVRLPAQANGVLSWTETAQLSEHLQHKSFFTNTETLQLARTIEQASAGNVQLERDTARFLLLLAETMELGLHALMAAAIHYTGNGEEAANAHVLQIAQNANALRDLEQHNISIKTPHDATHMRQLLLTETVDWRALAIRSGACLYQMNSRTARDALRIYAPLSSRLGMHKLKNELEESAFRILYPRSYQKVCQTDQLEASMQSVLESTRREITNTLASDAEFMRQVEEFSVTARVKEPYSLWKKMIKNGYDRILQVPDALALRVVLKARKESDDEHVEVTRGRERALCYYVQELCRKRWHPVEGNPRFKDYIQSPKTNGYQSLHYTATTIDYRGKEWTCEIQIRSNEMHQIAEFGLASHCEYKEEANGNTSVKRTMDPSVEAYLKNVQAWHWENHADTMFVDASPATFESVMRSDIWQSRERVNRIKERTERLQPYLDALTSTKSDLVHKQVVVFLNTSASSQVVSLPAGACVLDALRKSDHLGSNAMVNGEVIPITRQLHNGDVLELSNVSA